MEEKLGVMKIEYLAHSCFRLDESLVIDPYKDGSVPGLPPLKTTAQKVICTHGHADHSGVECVEVVPGDAGFEIEEVPSFHDDAGGTLRGPWVDIIRLTRRWQCGFARRRSRSGLFRCIIGRRILGIQKLRQWMSF